MTQDPILTINNVSKVYHSSGHIVQALKHINLTIHRGETLALLGVNGAGKTTLSSILATLHPPTAGDILFNGKSIYQDIYAYRQQLGFCPQKQNLDEYLTVEQNLIFAGKYFLLPNATIYERAAMLMDQLDLRQYASREIDELSGGTKQRVLIARALMNNPSILILDEPTVGLDPDIRKKLWELINHLKQMGLTVILTTHYLDEAEALGDRVCILHYGDIKLIESIHRLKEQHNTAKLEDIFLKLMDEYRERNA